MSHVEITEQIKYIGADDKTLDLFESQYLIPNGVSYNSYLILDEKIAVMDTVDMRATGEWLRNMDRELQGKEPDYLIVSHMEPDHAANIEMLARRYPKMQIVANAKTFPMMEQFFNLDVSDRKVVVAEGDTLNLGKHTLQFFMAPMVHWPEVMVTYEQSEKILFSADGFGTFGSLDANEEWIAEARKYYINIVGKYGNPVQALLKKASGLDIQMICPLHGPIWRKDLGLLLEKYQKWSTYDPEDKTVMIAYATMYGNTENAANVLAGMLADKGVKNIAMYDVSETDVSELVAESFRCSHLVLAAPTYNSRIQPKMEAYLSDIKALNLQNRTVAVIDNGTWAATAGKQMIGTLEGMKNMTILENTISIKSALAENQLGALEALADELAKQVNG